MSAYFQNIDQSLFNLGDLGTFQSRDVTESIVDFKVSLSLSQSSQISVSVLDPSFTFARGNYFQVRRDIFYRNLWFEISAVETQRSASVHPLYNIECRSKAIQLMKRDKKPEAYRGMTAYDFAFAIAKRFGLNFVGEKTAKRQSIVKAKSSNADDSVWTVLQSLASDQKFVCFESEGTLFFCSETFLMGKWGDPNFAFGQAKFIPFFYPETNDPVFASVKDKYVLLEQPTLRRSDDDINAAEGSMLVDRFNGVHLRPGMTIYLGGIPDFESFYLITDVQFAEGAPEPVTVQFRLPVDPSKEKISTSTTQGTSGTAGNRGSNVIGTVPGSSSSTSTTGSSTSNTGSSSSTSTSTTQTQRPTVKKYTQDALGRLRLRTSNGSLIIKTVETAVTQLNNKVAPQTVIKNIKSTPGLSEIEKDISETIYIMYVLGEPVSKLGTSGGLSPDAVDQKRTTVTTTYDSTPSTVTPSSQITPTEQGFSLTLQNPADIDVIHGYITDYINKNQAFDKTNAISLAKVAASTIFRQLPNKTDKIKRMKKLYTDWGNGVDRVKYNSLAQHRVLAKLIPGFTSADGIPSQYKLN